VSHGQLSLSCVLAALDWGVSTGVCLYVFVLVSSGTLIWCLKDKTSAGVYIETKSWNALHEKENEWVTFSAVGRKIDQG